MDPCQKVLVLIMILGTMMCIFSPNMKTLLVGRFVQGVGAGACASLWRAIFRDAFSGEDLSKYGAYLTTYLLFILPAAPVIGGYLAHRFGWRSNFIFLALYGIVALTLISMQFHETHTHHHRDRLAFTEIRKNYGTLLSSRFFMSLTATTFLTYGALFTWLTTGPILMIHVLHYTPIQFGWMNFLAAVLGYGLAGKLNGRWVKKVGIPTMLRLGWLIMLISGLFILASALFLSLHIACLLAGLVLLYFGSSWVLPNVFATAFTPYGHIAGYCAALYGMMQIGGGAALSGLMGCLPTRNAIPLGCVIVLATCCAWGIYEVFAKQKS
jgi:DHA1 family bicyclomycin/chloramphenicol resistance-like MFS transporter/DHA1 family 2-module integral membrane pump EmrD-like MFS transporter